MYGAETSTPAPNAAAHAAGPSAHSAKTHPAAKRAGTVSHSPAHRTTARRSGSAHYAGNKAGAHGTSKAALHSTSASAAKGTARRTTASATSRKGTAVHSRSSGSKPSHRSTPQQRWARLHLQPERTTEIQRALIREGYLQGDPSGQWDTQTHEAMVRYQTMNGFPATGLPEAKSLMKLGLGAHPLPPELDHGTVGIPGPAAQGNVPATLPPPPVSQAIPPS